MGFRDFLSKDHELEFMRIDALGGLRFSMGHMRLYTEDRKSGVLRFVVDRVDNDCILDGMEGNGEYFQYGFDGSEYIHLFGINDRQAMVCDLWLRFLDADNQSGLHLFGKYGYKGMPIAPLTIRDLQHEPIDPHAFRKTYEAEHADQSSIISQFRSKRGDDGSIIVGSGWIEG